jgi:hypothetical protein
MKFLKKSGEPWVGHAIELATLVVVFLGFALSYRELEKNRESNLTTCRAQIYEGDRALFEREYQDQNGSLNSIYFDPEQLKQKPEDYAAERLKLISASYFSEAELQSLTLDKIFDAIYGLGAVERRHSVPNDATDVRRAARHIEAYLYHLESVSDYSYEHVITKDEWLTWRAWFANIGPHPLLLLSVRIGVDNKYISRGFAEDIREALLEDSANRQVIEKFYPEFLTSDFRMLPDAQAPSRK